jgi:KDO2-lipid IV(A) lauroyltransferase
LLAREREVVRARLCAGLVRAPDDALVRATFVTAGELLADTLALLRPDERASSALSLDPEDERVFAAALGEGRGVVFVAAHLGPWERMAALLVEHAFPVATVARESYDPRLTAIYERIRSPRGVRSIYRGRPGAAVAIARELAAGRAVGFLVDVPARVPSVPGRLFGMDTRIPVGPARIALARRAAVLIGTCAPPAPEEARARGPHLPRVRITRISTDDLPRGKEGERILVERITKELDQRIAAWPVAWLGAFAAP